MQIRKKIIPAVAWLFISVVARVTTAEDLPVYFRSDGGVAGAESFPVPDRLDSPKALRWRTPLDSGHSTPTVCKDRIFLTTFNAAKEELATLAISVDSGKILWKRIAPASGIEEIQDPPEVNPQELALAAQLIDSITQSFDPKQFQDQYRNAVLDVIKAKVEGREVVEPPQVETGKVINLMEALKSSLERTQTDSTSQPGDTDEKELSATGTDSATSQ